MTRFANKLSLFSLPPPQYHLLSIFFIFYFWQRPTNISIKIDTTQELTGDSDPELDLKQSKVRRLLRFFLN